MAQWVPASSEDVELPHLLDLDCLDKRTEKSVRSFRDGHTLSPVSQAVGSAASSVGPRVTSPLGWRGLLSVHGTRELEADHARQGRRRWFCRLARWTAVALYSGVWAGALAWLWHAVLHCSATEDAELPLGRQGAAVKSAAAVAAMVAFLAFEYLRVDESRLTQQARFLLFFLSLEAVATLVPREVEHGRQRARAEPMYRCGFHLISLGQVWSGFGAVQHRVELMEHAFGAPLGSRRVRLFRFVAMVPDALLAGAFLVVQVWVAAGHEFPVWLHTWSREASSARTGGLIRFHAGLIALAWLAACVVVWRSFSVLLAATQANVGKVTTTYLHAEAAWARATIARVRWATSLSSLIHLVSWACEPVLCIISSTLPLTWPFGSFEEFMLVAKSISDCIESVGELVCLLIMVGFFRPIRPAAVAEELQQKGCPSPSRARHPVASPAWEATVHALAHRRLEVAALLDFYKRLGPGGEAMPGYDPWRHTTNDVVRCAIIPLSRLRGGGGAAYASLAPAQGAEQLPARMVTHTWSNLFLHLVATVVADALGCCVYEGVAITLAVQGPGALEAKLAAAGTLHQGYWICAFCVNQHANICDGFGGEPIMGTRAWERWDASRRDSVTGRLHQCCGCREPKVLNGRDECELNKFDDMMRYLQRCAPDLRQLIAMDAHFETLTRVWCVAELVEAYISGIPQNVCLLSNDVFESQGDIGAYVKLATLSVEECNATREEDKDAILQKIPNTEEFNAQLQAVIYSDRGLFAKRLVAFDVLYVAAQTAKRVRSAVTLSGGGAAA